MPEICTRLTMEDAVDPTEYQKQVIFGAILGDGRLERPKQGNSRLQIRHSIRQEPYVVYKHEILKPLSLNLLSYTYFDSRTGRNYKQVGFNTIRDYYFTKLYHQFYREGVKRVPEQFITEMNEVALAILVGDDGTYDPSSKTVKISVDRYTHEDRELLRHWLKTNFKIDASVQKDRVYILRSSFPKLIRIVSNHLPRFMHYKLGLGPPP
jgi:hypothetical protein